MNGYRDRAHAGDVLANELTAYHGRDDVTVLGLVRGGVPVAARVARALAVPLDVLVVRKLGVPWAPEVAFGALGAGGVQVLNPDVAGRLDERDIAEVIAAESAELDRRERTYRAGRPPLALAGRTGNYVVQCGHDRVDTFHVFGICCWNCGRHGCGRGCSGLFLRFFLRREFVSRVNHCERNQKNICNDANSQVSSFKLHCLFNSPRVLPILLHLIPPI